MTESAPGRRAVVLSGPRARVVAAPAHDPRETILIVVAAIFT
jgi:hypothetical protein